MLRTPLLGAILMCAAASGQTPEAAVLGGPCLAESDFPRDLISRSFQATRGGDRESAVAIAKQIVRRTCSSEHWWLKLAESLMDLKREREAIQTLDAFYTRGTNAVGPRLRDATSPLHKLLTSADYRNSPLARKLARDRNMLDKRRADAQAKLATEPHPPEPYVAKGACPFECCVFRSWSVKTDTVLYDKPAGTTAVGRAAKGTRVTGITGEVHLRPVPVRVRFPAPEGFKAQEGDIVYLLNYTGEGHGMIWRNGKVLDGEVMWVAEHCALPKADCWGEFVNAADAGVRKDHVWWVKVKTPRGIVGWTKQTDHFGDMDACG